MFSYVTVPLISADATSSTLTISPYTRRFRCHNEDDLALLSLVTIPAAPPSVGLLIPRGPAMTLV